MTQNKLSFAGSLPWVPEPNENLKKNKKKKREDLFFSLILFIFLGSGTQGTGSQTLLASENEFNSTGRINSTGTVGDARRLCECGSLLLLEILHFWTG